MGLGANMVLNRSTLENNDEANESANVSSRRRPILPVRPQCFMTAQQCGSHRTYGIEGQMRKCHCHHTWYTWKTRAGLDVVKNGLDQCIDGFDSQRIQVAYISVDMH